MHALNKGALVISIDYEFAWGYADKNLSKSELEPIRHEAEISQKILGLFEKYKIPATWAVVGRLVDKSVFWRYENDIAFCDANDFVGKILKSDVGHEVASHSYAHIVYGETTEEDVENDMSLAKKVHDTNNLDFKTFIFPRNSECCHHILKRYGIENYRGLSSKWYTWLPRSSWPLWSGIDYWLPLSKLVMPREGEHKLIDVSDSLAIFSRKGLKKLLPVKVAESKLKRGISDAAKKKRVFHLWFHPSNFSWEMEKQLRILGSALKFASEMRRKKKLDILTMREIAELYRENER